MWTAPRPDNGGAHSFFPFAKIQYLRIVVIRSLLTISVPIAFWLPALSQSPLDLNARSAIDPVLWPFCHGVASGDPLSDRVILWTRLTPDFLPAPYQGTWKVATDTGIVNVVRTGTFGTDSSSDFTVQVDVDSLQANTWYYYRFEMNNRKSLTGRTRTLPEGDVDSLRFAVVSCAEYSSGFFHGYKLIAARNDVDAVIHLGDYIYENGSEGTIGRPHDPPEKLTELSDYRQRYSQYRLDPDLRYLHQLYPFIVVWDDHEFANNSWSGGADGHVYPADGLWEHRKRMAVKAFFEWIPMRKPDPSDTLRIYRTSHWGDLASFVMMDTRMIGRDSQSVASAFGDSSRYMVGPQQLSWIANEIDSSAAQWKVFGQQVFMAPLEIPLLGPVNPDQWDGYAAERNRFYDTLISRNVENTVVLTGDIHTAWANNLEKDTAKVGVEFVCSSITTDNFPFPVPAAVITLANPHIKYAEVTGHGYTILDINKQRAQADFYFCGDILDAADSSETAGPFWYSDDTDRFLKESSSASVPRTDFPVLLPPKAANNPVGIGEAGGPPEISVIGLYPNPFWDDFVIKAIAYRNSEFEFTIADLQGRIVRESQRIDFSAGLHYIKGSAIGLSSGNYLVQWKTGGVQGGRIVTKI